MAEHLLKLNYRKIGFASLPVGCSNRLRARRRGFLAGLRAAGNRIEARLIVEVAPGLESGSRALATLVEAEPGLDAVFFSGDVLAAGATFECQRRGIEVPSGLAIAASDDNDLMRNIVPPLTTVRFPRYEIGVRAAELIIARALGGRRRREVIDLGFEVIRRGTT
jgi:LacI family gluconate utilization system Gnt-I transcriptional repressor